MLKVMLSSLCVLAAASPLAAAIGPADIGGRWQGQTWTMETAGKLTLDIVRCGSGWCGIKVEADNRCGGTALKLDAGEANEGYSQYSGTLQLAPNTEPYVIRTSFFAPEANEPAGTPLQLQITGDTGGQFRAFRRSFPFEAQLVRIDAAVCHTPETISLLR